MLKCQVKFRTHAVTIHQRDNGQITCLKYNHNQTHCELESFMDAEAAGEFIIKPMPAIEYRVELNEE
jgi:hypothetical protein